jgi:hypothetical protein
MGITEAKKEARKQKRVIYADGNHNCQNSDLQRGVPAVRGFRLTPVIDSSTSQKLEIKRGAFGLGAFAVEGIHKNQFIGGTVFPPSTAWTSLCLHSTQSMSVN